MSSKMIETNGGRINGGKWACLQRRKSGGEKMETTVLEKQFLKITLKIVLAGNE